MRVLLPACSGRRKEVIPQRVTVDQIEGYSRIKRLSDNVASGLALQHLAVGFIDLTLHLTLVPHALDLDAGLGHGSGFSNAPGRNCFWPEQRL
jgi:hypothetical protein